MYISYESAGELGELITRVTGVKVTTDPAQAHGWHDSGERCYLLMPPNVTFGPRSHYEATWEVYAFPGRVGGDYEQGYRSVDNMVWLLHRRAHPVTSVRYGTLDNGTGQINVAIAQIETDHDIN